MQTVLSVAMLMCIALLVVFAIVSVTHRARQRIWRQRWALCCVGAAEIVDRIRAEFPGCEGVRAAITTEPGIRTSRNPSSEISDEDFARDLDRIRPADMPINTLAATEIRLKAQERVWNVDSFPSPKGAVGRADNEAAPGSGSALSRDWTSNVRKMGNVGQAFSETWRVGWIAEDLPHIPGVEDPLAYAKAGAYEMLKQHMEVAFGSFDQVAVYDAGAGLGAVGAGYLKLTASANAYATVSAYAIGKATDIHSAPSGAVLSGALSATHNRAMWKSVSKALRGAAKQNGDWVLIAGLDLRQAITDLTDPSITSSTATAGAIAAAAGQVRVLLRNETDTVLGTTVDVITTDFGRFLVTTSDYLGTTTTTSTGGALASVNATTAQRASAAFVNNPSAGIIVRRGNLWKSWGIMPFTETLGPDGGGTAMDSKCMAALGIRNPILAGTLNFS